MLGEPEHEQIRDVDGLHHLFDPGLAEYDVLDNLVDGNAALVGGVGYLVGNKRRLDVPGADGERSESVSALCGNRLREAAETETVE